MTFNKPSLLYRSYLPRPGGRRECRDVEGVLDALANAVGARRGEIDWFAPCTASGVTVSDAQVDRLLGLHARPPVIALDAARCWARKDSSRSASAFCSAGGRCPQRRPRSAGSHRGRAGCSGVASVST